MPHGGRRFGAGRNPKFSFIDRLAIGAACERRFTELWKQSVEDRWTNRPGVARLRYLQNKARVAASPKEQQDLSIQVEKLVRKMKRTPAFVAETKRGFTISAPRPKGVHAGICKAVAAEFSAKWECDDLGPRYVRRCWDEYRRFEKDEALDSGME